MSETPTAGTPPARSAAGASSGTVESPIRRLRSAASNGAVLQLRGTSPADPASAAVIAFLTALVSAVTERTRRSLREDDKSRGRIRTSVVTHSSEARKRTENQRHAHQLPR